MSLSNHFQLLPGGALALKGEMGKAIALCTKNFLKTLDWSALVVPFRERYETTSWRSEFWGKMLRGAILVAYTTQDAELKKIIKDTIYDMISTQDKNGCISTVAADKQPGTWDMWGRKYVLHAMGRYCQLIEKDQKIVNACCKVVDHMMTQMGAGKRNPLDVGYHEGLATCSAADAIMRVYRLSGKKKYLDFVKYILKTGCSKRGDIFQSVLDGKTPAEIANGKAYELTSCFQGLAEAALEDDGFPKAYDVLTKYYADVRDREILCTGVGGAMDTWGEYWFDTALKQNITDRKLTGALGETCVTVTWLHYLERILQITGDAKVFDQCELAFYNGLLGAMTPDGVNFTHRNPTPLAGHACKLAAPDQMLLGFNRAFHGMDCCRAQGPEGLALAGILGVMLQDNAPVFNLYEDMEVNYDGVKYTVTGGWPFFGSKVTIKLAMKGTKKMTLRFRVPEREKGKAFAKVGTKSYDGVPGTYLAIDRTWKNGDTIVLTFDQKIRKRLLPTTPNSFCLMQGPIVLAEDTRLNAYHAETDSYRIAIPDGERYLCDYASAGSEFLDVHFFQVVWEEENTEPLSIW